MNEQLRVLQEKLSAYDHAIGILTYDGETTAPKRTSDNRSHSIGILSEELYKLSVGEETVKLLEGLEREKESLSLEEQRMIEMMLKEIRDMQKIPMEEYVAFQELSIQATKAWKDAKDADDFEIFRPYLEKMVDYGKRFAAYCAPEKHPYDYMLNQFEEGLTQEKCDAFFGNLRERLVPLLRKIKESPQVDDSFLNGFASEANQEIFSNYLMDLMELDRNHVGLSTTEHPFTTSLGSHHDVRITTHYFEDNFASSMFSVIHEGGHALYDRGPKDEYAYTVLDGGVSMGIHESQSRFYENLIGRSRGFIELIFPKLKELFPDVIQDHSPEDIYRAINKVEPSLIRIEADEVTYSLHVMVRYELEKRLFSGELEVKDLPTEWNRLYKEYLGVDVPSDQQGVLQDSHWAGGLMGYFPSYALGSAYGAHFLKKMRETVDVDGAIKAGNLGSINKWNKENIWQYGCLYKPDQLIEKALGEPFSSDAYIDYLEKKYSEIYGF